MDNQEKMPFFDNPTNIKRMLWVFYAICAGLLAVDFFFHRHTVHPWEEMYGFYPLYGLGACVLLVLIAKEMRKVIMRSEDYYDDK